MPTVKIVPFPGSEGPIGPRGLQGIQGETGLTGPIGETGPAGADASFPAPIAWTPVLTSANGDFAQSANPSYGSYVKLGKIVFCSLHVSFENTTNFGTGIYSVTLPFPVAHHTAMHGGTLHDTSDGFFTITGHQATAAASTMSLWYQSIVTKDAEFDSNSPILLTTDDFFHMDFTYEIAE